MQHSSIAGGGPLGCRLRAKVRLSLCAAAVLAVTGSFAAVGDSLAGMPPWSKTQAYGSAAGDPDHGKRVADARCGACHGADGNSPDPRYPKLAGQDPAYLYRQLAAFNTGARRSDIMSGIARALSETDAVDVTTFYAQQTIRPDAATDSASVPIGERIFFTGTGPGRAPACAMCHGSGRQRGMMMGPGMMGRGMMGCGMMADIPKLKDQHATYLIDQLNRFADGRRSSAMMGMMNRIAAALSETDKKAVAEFLSSRP